MSIEIIPTGAALGAEIRGIDLAQPLDDATFAAIDRAYNEHGVIFFRDQRLTPPQRVAFTRRFGEIEFNVFGERWSVPGSPEIVVVSNACRVESRPSLFSYSMTRMRRKRPLVSKRCSAIDPKFDGFITGSSLSRF